MKLLVALAMLLLVSFGAAFAEQPTFAPVLNIRDFGAVADGLADDTAAFQAALEAGRQQQLPVYLPRGDYRLTQTIRVEQQLLTGEFVGGWPADGAPIAKLLIDHSEGPGILLTAGGSLNGFGLFYDWTKHEDFAPAILLSSANGTSITSLRLQYPKDGIIMDETGHGRNQFRDIFMVDPRGVGMYVRNTFDVPYLSNIEVWCNGGMRPGPAFQFGRNDEIRANSLFAFQTKIGLLFGQEETEDLAGGVSASRGAYGTFVDCATDACEFGIVVRDDCSLNFVGGDLWNHWGGLIVEHPDAHIRCTGLSFSTNGDSSIVVKEGGELILSACRIGRAFSNGEVVSSQFTNLRSLVMAGCSFSDQGPCVTLGAGLGQVSLLGNVFAPSQFEKLRNNCDPATELALTGNVGLETKE